MSNRPPRLAVHLGEHNIFSDEGTEQRFYAEKVIAHPNYNANTYDNDIMLIKLNQPAVFTNYVKSIPLPTGCSYTGEQCLVSGWGNQINNGGKMDHKLKCVLTFDN